MFYCFACLKIRPASSSSYKLFCISCADDLIVNPIRYRSGRSLFLYQGILRRLILRAKVHGDLQAMMLLCDLFVTHPQTIEAVRQCKGVMAVPSSFWGRIRGKPDLAWVFAKKLSKLWKVSMIPAPLRLHWNVHKRARARGRSHCDLNLGSTKSSISILIIDDVITSGFSVKRLASAIGDSNCKFLTLSVAATDASQTGSFSGE